MIYDQSGWIRYFLHVISILPESCEHDQAEYENNMYYKILIRCILYCKILLVISVEINAYLSRHDHISHQSESDIKVHIQCIDGASICSTPKNLLMLHDYYIRFILLQHNIIHYIYIYRVVSPVKKQLWTLSYTYY